MSNVETLSLAPLLLGLIWAAVEDWRHRRIPNWLTFGLILTGIAQSFGSLGTVSPSQAGLGFLIGFGITLLPFLLGALGGGDVKLLAGAGAWLGVRGTIELLVVVAIVAMLAAIVQMIAQRRAKAVLSSTAVVALSLMHARELGATHAAETARTGHGVDRPLPYAVPVLVGLVILLVSSWA